MDLQTLQRLIDDHGAALTLYARQWCVLPDDAVQEALLALLRQSPAPDRPIAWLYTAVRRRALNLTRSEGRRARHQRLAGEARPAWFVPEESPLEGDGFDPADCQRLLAGLDPRRREIVVARIWGELSFAEIAELVELPLSTVHRYYQLALRELANLSAQSHTWERNADGRPTIS